MILCDTESNVCRLYSCTVVDFLYDAVGIFRKASCLTNSLAYDSLDNTVLEFRSAYFIYLQVLLLGDYRA